MALLNLKVKAITKGKSVNISVLDTASIFHIKNEISSSMGIPADHQRLTFKGKTLKDGDLKAAGVRDGDIVVVTVKKQVTPVAADEGADKFYVELRHHLQQFYDKDQLQKLMAKIQQLLESRISQMNLEEIERYCVLKLSEAT